MPVKPILGGGLPHIDKGAEDAVGKAASELREASDVRGIPALSEAAEYAALRTLRARTDMFPS